MHPPTKCPLLFLRRALANAAKPVNVVCDIKLSDAVRRSVLALGGRPILEEERPRVHAFARDRGASTARSRCCGHYFYQELGYGDDGLFAACYLIDLLHRSAPLAPLIDTLDRIYSTPELRLPESVMSYAQVAERLRREFPNAPETHLDGMRMELTDGIVLARRSSTEPVVSLRIEGFDRPGFEKLVERCLSSLDTAASVLRDQIREAKFTAA